MGNKRKPKAVASTVNNAKKEAEPRDGALRRAAKAGEKASAREKKVRGNVHERSSQLDAALMALEETDVGSPQARAVEKAARAALKALLVQRKKLRKARKALRRAEAKARKADDRTPAAAVKKSPAQAPAAQSRKASKKPPAKKPPVKTRPAKKRPTKKRQTAARAQSSATKSTALDTLPATAAVSGVDAGRLQGSTALPTDRSV
jgi:hypothetical protein